MGTVTNAVGDWSIGAIVANIRVNVEREIVRANANLIAQYQFDVGRWLTARTGQMPPVPMAYEMGEFIDPNSNQSDPTTTRWPMAVRGKAPVCAAIAVPDLPGPVAVSPNAAPAGVPGAKEPLPASLRGLPLGFQLHPPDGSTWEIRAANVGTWLEAHWLECVKAAG